MQIGFNLPNSGPLSAVASMTEIAIQGEARAARLTPHGSWEGRPLEF